MGLCVHPALLWSRAGQASIWVQAKNSFPWREPPTRPRQQGWSRGCRGKQVLPTLSPGRRRDRPGAGTRNRVLSLPAGYLLPCEGFWSSYIRKQCIPGIAASPVIRETREWPGPVRRTLLLSLHLLRCGPHLDKFSETPRTSGHPACTNTRRVPLESCWHPPWGNESLAGCIQGVEQALGRFSCLLPSLAGLKLENHSVGIRC